MGDGVQGVLEHREEDEMIGYTAYACGLLSGPQEGVPGMGEKSTEQGWEHTQRHHPWRSWFLVACIATSVHAATRAISHERTS
ncbi:hypothetical protein H920_05060 [Fukomys damarensis]|uniref:Uncharacterized protein n=1 Tax=Fukomys damarensis TaxID=885580 RepID=A0A091DSQ9_FUKDA|nr:hypothetical protein H920_05060 [Fukomys damarensis]